MLKKKIEISSAYANCTKNKFGIKIKFIKDPINKILLYILSLIFLEIYIKIKGNIEIKKMLSIFITIRRLSLLKSDKNFIIIGNNGGLNPS